MARLQVQTLLLILMNSLLLFHNMQIQVFAQSQIIVHVKPGRGSCSQDRSDETEPLELIYSDPPAEYDSEPALNCAFRTLWCCWPLMKP